MRWEGHKIWDGLRNWVFRWLLFSSLTRASRHVLLHISFFPLDDNLRTLYLSCYQLGKESNQIDTEKLSINRDSVHLFFRFYPLSLEIFLLPPSVLPFFILTGLAIQWKSFINFVGFLKGGMVLCRVLQEHSTLPFWQTIYFAIGRAITLSVFFGSSIAAL